MVRIHTEVATLGDLLIRAASEFPDRAAVVFPDDRFSYRELLAEAEAVARGLAGLGVGPGSHVGLLLPNGRNYLAALFGIALLGAVAAPMNIRHKSVELGYIIGDADLAVVVTSQEGADHVDLPSIISDALPGLAAADATRPLELPTAPRLRHVVQLDGPDRPGLMNRASFYAAGAGISPEMVEAARRTVRIRDPGLILYTSGTTANPKGCVLSHEAITRGPVERARYRLRASDHDVVWAAGPLFHIGSLAPFIGCVGASGTFLSDRFFHPGRALKLMVQEGVTQAWPWFSAIVQDLIDHPTFSPDALGSLRHLLLIAPATLVDRVQRLLPHTEVLQACGMTETAGIFALSDPDESLESRANTQGRAAPGIEIRIVDPETGVDLPPGQMGEILVRGYCVMDGYYGDPAKTQTALQDGWLRTGDLYVRNQNGGLLFQGRLKDMLKVGGENVATMEVETFLCSHPDVKLAEVVGRPDARLDEVPVAFVELRPSTTLTPDDLIAFCRGRIASYKTPRDIIFMQPGDWPMSATKVDKRALRERLRQPPT